MESGLTRARLMKEQATRCRRLAKHADPFTQKRLLDLASEYDAKIATLEPAALCGVTNFGEWRGISRRGTQHARHRDGSAEVKR